MEETAAETNEETEDPVGEMEPDEEEEEDIFTGQAIPIVIAITDSTPDPAKEGDPNKQVSLGAQSGAKSLKGFILMNQPPDDGGKISISYDPDASVENKVAPALNGTYYTFGFDLKATAPRGDLTITATYTYNGITRTAKQKFSMCATDIRYLRDAIKASAS